LDLIMAERACELDNQGGGGSLKELVGRCCPAWRVLCALHKGAKERAESQLSRALRPEQEEVTKGQGLLRSVTKSKTKGNRLDRPTNKRANGSWDFTLCQPYSISTA
jgi:hypothetical protein